MKLEKIHEDERGEIYILTECFSFLEEATIFVTKNGYARGGCIHRINNEYCTVIEGEALYRVDDTIQQVLEGRTITIPKGSPHYFVSVGDSVILEWGATTVEKKEIDLKMRKIVENINEKNRTNKA